MAHAILLLEDEINVGSTVRDRLTLEGFEVNWVSTVQEAKQSIQTGNYSLALLDVNLPDGSGFDAGKIIRARFAKTAMVF